MGPPTPRSTLRASAVPIVAAVLLATGCGSDKGKSGHEPTPQQTGPNRPATQAPPSSS